MAMRDKILKSRIYRIVLLIMLLSMSGGGIISFLFSPFLYKKHSMQPIIVMVNDQEITHQEYERRLARETERIALLRQQYGGQALDALLEGLGLANPQVTAINTLIEEKLVNRVAQDLNLDVSPALIKQKLSDPSAILDEFSEILPFGVIDQQGAIDMPSLNRWLQQRGMTFTDFEHSLEEALKRKIVYDLVGATAYVSPAEAKDYFAATYLRRKYDVLRLPFERYLKKVSAKPLSHEEVETFFVRENKATKKYWVPEKRSGFYWKFSPHEFGINVADKDIERYYQENKRRKFMKTPIQVNVGRILLKIGKGLDVNALQEQALNIKEELDKDPQKFKDLAEKYSQDEKTAKNGGQTGFFQRGDRDQSFERAAFRLKEDGDISPIIKTADGLEILQRISRKPAVFQEIDAVKGDIKKILLAKKFSDRFKEETQHLIDQQPQEDHTLINDFILKKKAEKKSFDNLILDTSLFARKVFKTKKNAWNAFVDQDGSGILLSVQTIEKRHEPSLVSIQKKVENDLYNQQALQQRDADMLRLQKRAQTESLKNLSKEFDGELIQTDWLKKDDTTKIHDLENKGIPVKKLFFLPDAKSIAIALKHDDGFVAKIEATEPFDEVLFEDKRSEIMQKMYQEKKELEKRGFLASLYRNATIKTSEHQENQQNIPLGDIGF
jgi:parvulin-like peptidyl-prolyl isomerase